MYQENSYAPVRRSPQLCDGKYNGDSYALAATTPQTLIFARKIDSAFFARHIKRLSDFYCDIFNSVESAEAINAGWTGNRAAEFIAARLTRPGINIALLNDDRLIGLYLNLIVPKATGIALVEGELALHHDFRRDGLGSELVYFSKQYAEAICRSTFGEDPVVDETTTYRRPAFPKQWWLRIGYRPATRYELKLTAIAGLLRPVGVKFHVATRGELPAIAAFMCNSESTHLGGSRWSFDRATSFLNFMFSQNPSLMRIAATEDGIVGLIVADLIPRRCGFYLGQTLVAVSSCATAPFPEICRGLLIELAQAGSQLSDELYGVPPVGIELTGPLGEALRCRLPYINEDPEFIDMSIDHHRIMSALRPRQPPRIQFVEPVGSGAARLEALSAI